jgi:hypothetical protein
MRTHPNGNLDRLSELSFEFDQSGQIIACNGTIKDGSRSIDDGYAGAGLARLYEMARRRFTVPRPKGAILKFPAGQKIANA